MMRPRDDLVTYGNVVVEEPAFVGSYCVIGAPAERTIVRQLQDGTPGHAHVASVTIASHCIIGNHVTIHEGATIGTGAIVEDRVRIGHRCRIGARSRIMYGAYVCDRVVVGDDARIAGFVCDGASIGDGSTVMGALVHEYTSPHEDWWAVEEGSPVIDPEAVVGYHATVIGPVRIGRHSYVAAGATVTRDVPPGHVVTAVDQRTPLREWSGSGLEGLIAHWLET